VHPAPSMPILFSGDKINQALNQHEESIQAHRTQLNEIQSSIEEKVDATIFAAKLEQLSSMSAEKLDATVLEWQTQVSTLRDRVDILETQQRELQTALACKAEAAWVSSQEANLARRVSALEGRQEELTSTVVNKADAACLEGQRQRLAVAQEQLGSLQRDHSELAARVATKADVAQADALQEEAAALAAALRGQGEELGTALAAKAGLQRHEELEQLLRAMQEQLAELERDLRRELAEAGTVLAKTVDLATFEEKARQLEQAHERLASLDQRQAMQHGETIEALARKTDTDAASQQQEKHAQLQASCAYKDDMLREFRWLQEQLDANRAQGARQHEQLCESLAQKLERDTFEQLWEQVVVKDIRSEIKMQRNQLSAALEKKDQLISLAERMQADLTCALALRGRGPPRLGPLVPSPSPRKIRGVKSTSPELP